MIWLKAFQRLHSDSMRKSATNIVDDFAKSDLNTRGVCDYGELATTSAILSHI